MTYIEILTPSDRPDEGPMWPYQVRLSKRTLHHVLPVERLLQLWAELTPVHDRHGIQPSLMLALALVETALSDGTWDPVRFFPARVTQRLLHGGMFGTAVTADLAAGYLAAQLQRFGQDLSLALLAYHTDPDLVAHHGARVLDDAGHQDYLQAVRTTASWLDETRPWDLWPALLAEALRPEPARRLRPLKPPSPRERAFNLLAELDELILFGYHQDDVAGPHGALLKAALPSGWKRLKRFLDSLSNEERHLLTLLNHKDRLSRHAAAQGMGISTAAFNKRLARLVTRLIQGGFVV